MSVSVPTTVATAPKDTLPSVASAVLGSMSLRQVKSFKVTEGQEPSARLTDGGQYFGDLDNQRRPHGKGIAILGDGISRYGGEWKQGHYHGTGAMCASTFDYEGTWDMDEMHGYGTIFYKDTVVAVLLRGVQLLSPFDATHKPLEYRGDFHKTYHRHGKGTMTYRNGDVYEGDWNSNRRSGHGNMRYVSGERYQGEWLNDERHGTGVVHYSNGSVFRGTFEHDNREGQKCSFTLPSGDEYVGTFHKDEITGAGIMRYKNGDVYEGQWKDGVRHGAGKFELKKRGATIEGTFVKGLIDGEATVTFPGKSKYIGSFEKGEKVFGTHFNEGDGSCYQGEWRSDTMHGLGLQWSGNGDFYYGRFANSKREGYGNCNYVDGGEYSGEFSDDKRHGRGIAQGMDGSIRAGWWANDAFVRGYQGEWDGVAFSGLGTLQFDSDCEYFGIFQDGKRDGRGIMKVPKQRCNAAALAAHDAVLVWRTVRDERTNIETLIPPHDRNVTDGIYVFGQWSSDLVHGEAYIQYPDGTEFEGRCNRGVRENDPSLIQSALEPNVAHIRSPFGHEYIGGMKADGQDDMLGVFLSKNMQKPIYAELTQKEKDHELVLQVEQHRALAEQQKRRSAKTSSFFDALNPMNLFRPRSDSSASGEGDTLAKVERRIIGYDDDYIVASPWIACGRDELHLANLCKVDIAKTMPMIGAGRGSDMPQNKFQSQSATRSGSSPVSSSPAVATYPSGTACGLCVFFYCEEGTIFQTDVCENRPVLHLEHRFETCVRVPPLSRLGNQDLVRGPATITASSDAASSQDATPKNCVHCNKEFGMFRKAAACEACQELSCGSCLTELNPLTFDKNGHLSACIAARLHATGATPSFSSKSRSLVCPKCISCSSQNLTWGTYWIPLSQAPKATPTTPYSAEDLSLWVVYRGALSGSKPQGDGELWCGNVAYYQGSFACGQREGVGQQMYSNGESYVGEWHQDQRCGVGRYHCRDGSVIIGIWKNNKLQNIRYHGDVAVSGKRCGRGISFEPDGSRFNGEWKEDVQCGSGILQHATGDIYSGNFSEGVYDGLGKLVHSASVYVGSFVRGKRHGRGVERFGDRIVEGVWIHGYLSGKVRIFDSSKEDIYDACYREGSERRDIFLQQPIAPDATSLNCFHCRAVFGFFLRKHHCRLCGECFCDDCSKSRSPVPNHFHLDGQQRVCDKCDGLLRAGQSLGIRRYGSGAVYCGLWANGAWTGSGLYIRPDGTKYLLNSLPSNSISAISTPTASSAPAPHMLPSAEPNGDSDSTSRMCSDPMQTEECHRHLPSRCELPRASEEDIKRFESWWDSVVEACGIGTFPLTLEQASTFDVPKWNPSVPLNLFSLSDDQDETAEQRRTAFQPSAIPTVPIPPLNKKPEKKLFGAPLALRDDAKQMELITSERIERFMPFQPPTPSSPSDVAGDDGVTIPLSITLRCYAKQKINAETPLRPPHFTNQKVTWNAWSCYPVPEYKGIGGTFEESYTRSVPLVCVPDCGKRFIPLAPLDGPLSFHLVTSRSGSVEVHQEYV